MGTAPSSSAREASKRETRRALLRAAREAFAEEGLEGPSLDAICARAGFTRGAFYVHFRSREDLVVAVIEETLREFVDGVVAVEGSAGDVASTIERYTAVARFLRERSGRPATSSGVPFHQILEAARRAPRIGALLRAVSAEARARLERGARAAQAEARLTDRAAPRELATLLLVLALGVLAAEELELPFDLPASRDALLALLTPR
jgi:TetR/AcrR family transcriptional regulator, transcriptional repressor for nem operon